MCFFFSSRRRHTRWNCDWSSDVCSSDLFCKRNGGLEPGNLHLGEICKMAHAINNPAGTASIKSDSVATTRPSYQAYQILRFAFTVAPIVAGLDKFFHLLVNWDQYLPSTVNSLTG